MKDSLFLKLYRRDCRLQMYVHIGVATLTQDSYSFHTVLHLANGTSVGQRMIRLDKISQFPDTPIRDFNTIKDALVGGASASYRVDLGRCDSDEENFNLDSFGGQIDEFQYVPAGPFGPVGYLRIAGQSLIITEGELIQGCKDVQQYCGAAIEASARK